ncbi:glycoside hydrolase family 2 TIM barrel-domain containing protein [Microbacterium sp.]|uniref:glycoside hydrolase family 2 TIM barrel-domain containing protein n=1 Tax=Microbacterium sp. TaxID=51671 RepID=UPI003C782865
MTFDIDRIADPAFFSDNRVPAHSDHRWFADAAEAGTGASSFEQSLNGRWSFRCARNQHEVPVGFTDAGYDVSAWDEIRVPSHLQLEGYDRPQYVNVGYAWDGQEDIQPGQVPERDNPVGCYARTFTLDAPLREGERLSVSFHGAESAIALWLNGTYIGYSTDSFTPSEFDLTDVLLEGENRIAAQVFSYSAGSWLEDQDFFRFSGIFRDVVLYRRPAVHAEDLHLSTLVADDLASADVVLRVELAGAGSASARIDGLGELTEREDGALVLHVENPRLWSTEDPHLHDLVIEVRDEAGVVTEVIPQRVGIRRFGIENGVLSLNGARVVFNGVNRHEFSLDGRVPSRATTESDIRAMKALGVNAVRTSHYPNDSAFYALADEYGLLVIDEMNLETHGRWASIREGGASLDAALPGDHDEWRPAVLDRARSMLRRDRNHPSVVIWSCGNESFGGSVLRDVADWFRSADGRPVHYEGVHWDPRYPETTDITSQMYTTAAGVEQHLREHRDKPFLLCEYAHAMGNSFGGVGDYIDLAYRDELFQGGFIWDFADQAIRMRDRYGREFFGYGGDNGEAPHDGDFSGNGILFADHTPTPKAQEVKKLYQGFVVDVTPAEVVLTNRMLFTASSAYETRATISREGRVVASGVIDTDVAPGAAGAYPLPVSVPDVPGEYAIVVSLHLRAATEWAPVGYEIAWGEHVVSVGAPATRVSAPTPQVVEGTVSIGVHGPGFHVLFSRIFNGLSSYRFGGSRMGGRELLSGVVTPNFWHAPTSNERGWNGPFEEGQWLLASRYGRASGYHQPADISVSVEEPGVRIGYRYELPTNPVTHCDLSYLVDGSGRVEVTQRMHVPEGLPQMPEFATMLAMPADYDRVRWYGEGPEECYVDRRAGARLGVYERSVADMLPAYLKPQESGSRTGVRWAEVTDARGVGLRFEGDPTLEFSALSWTPAEIESAQHPHELPPVHRTIVRPALMRRGVAGDDSWGARPLERYLLPTGDLELRFAFQGI